MNDYIEERKFRSLKVAPEGSFGYLIAIGLAIPSACFFGSFVSFGLLYNDFLTSIEAGTSAVTVIFGFFALSTSISGLIASSLMKKYSLRAVGLLGAILYTLGSFLLTFVTSVEHMIIAFGIMEGAGIGLIFNAGYTNFNHYFVKRRVFMMSVTQILKGMLATAYPISVQFLVEKYGFRGATAIIAAVHAHAIFGMIVMHPVEWHYKVIKVPVEESKPLMNTDDKMVKVTVYKVSDNENKVKIKISNNNYRLSEPELHKETKDDNSGLGIFQSNRSKSFNVLQASDGFDSIISKRISSIMSLDNLGGAAILSETEKRQIPSEKSNRSNGKWQKVVDFLDLTLLKDIVYLNMVIGITFTLYSDGTFYTLLPMYLFELGFTKSDAASVVSSGFVADFSSRVFLAIVSYYIPLTARYVFLTGAVATLLIRIVFMNVYSFYAIAAMISMMSFFRTFFHCMTALVIAEYLPAERFGSAYGLLTFIQGMVMFSIAPIFGWIRDVTQSYAVCFNTLTSLMCFSCVTWTAELLWFRFVSRKTQI